MPVTISELQTTINGAENPMVVTCKILIDGQELPSDIPVTRVLIDREINRVPQASITILDGDVSIQDFSRSNMDLFVPGKSIEIQLGYNSNAGRVFKGIIIGQGNRVSGTTTELVLQCRDEAVKMTLARRHAHFNDMTDSDLAAQIIGNYSGLQADVESTGITHTNLVQHNLTDWDFLLQRFDLLGMFCTVEDGTIKLKKPDLQKEKVLDVVYGATLMEYQGGLDARSQSSAVEAGSWDFASQELSTGSASEPGLQEAGDIAATRLAEALGYETEQLRFEGKWSTAELSAAADARLMRKRLARIRGSVKFQGTAVIKPNEFIVLGGVGNRFSGPLYVSSVRHTYEEGNWLSELQLGMDPAWFAERINPYHPQTAGGLLPSVHGLYIGKVTDIEDPESEGRVRVALPSVNGAEQGIWARVATLDAGSERGTFFRPEAEDEVVVGFLADDPRHPVILGMLHSSAKATPLQPESANNEKGYVSRSGFKMIFNDEQKSLTIESPGGRKIIVHDQDGKITIDDGGGNTLTMESSGTTVEASGNLTLKAGGTMKIEGATVSINGSGTTEIKGGMVQIN